MTASGSDAPGEGKRWLDEFRARHGRAPRVLHVGNIANNAYKNVRLLNRAGLDCDVICYDYYHLMGCPEWEDADIRGSVADQFRPDWRTVDLGGYARPQWFAQGPQEDCIAYLLARRCGTPERAARLWRRLGITNRTVTERGLEAYFGRLRDAALRVYRPLNVLLDERKLLERLTLSMREGAIGRRFRTETARLAAVALLLNGIIFLRVLLRIFRRRQPPPDFVDATIARFRTAFSGRADQLTARDLAGYDGVPLAWSRLFEQYDLVQAYATDPILPMIAGKRPYIAFEHGTLRDFTLADNAVSRLNALAYHDADHVFITNGDCLDYARRIGVTRYTAMLHPIDEAGIRANPAMSPDMRAQLGVRRVFLCTLRHDWAVKGTDKYIRALPEIVRSIGPDFKLVMTKWGAQLNASMQLAAELGVADRVHWIEPLPKHALARMQKSVDILFDQIALPHFGVTAPEGIAAGVPVIMSYEPASTEWIVDQPAPVLPAWTVEEIVKNVRLALDPEWLAAYRERAAQWIDRCHSSAIVVQRHLDAYAAVLGPRTAKMNSGQPTEGYA